jgi:formylglycine-generating enzyme required for sulfatase activity
MSSGAVQKSFKDLPRGVRAVAIDTKRKLVAIGEGWDPTVYKIPERGQPPPKETDLEFQGGAIRLWSIESGTIVKQVPAHMGAVTSLAISPDGERLASGSEDKTVKIWTLPGLALERTLVGHAGGVLSVAFEPGGRLVASDGEDGARLWDLSTGKLARVLKPAEPWSSQRFGPAGRDVVTGEGTLVRVNNTQTGESVALLAVGPEWVAFSPDGYFDASKDGGGLVAMSRGVTPFGVDQLAASANRPDLLLSRIGMAGKDEIDYFRGLHQRRLARLGLKEGPLSVAGAPDAEILGLTTKGRIATVRFRIAARTGSLKSYNVWVDDVPVFGAGGKPIAGKEATRSESVELVGGESKIEISCTDAAGIESLRALGKVEAAELGKPDLYFLGFGVSKYRNPSLALSWAHKDASDLGELFASLEGRTFGKVHVRTYLDGQVTVPAVKAAGDFVKGAKADDVFVLFVAGHGMHAEGGGAAFYYLTSEAEPARLADTAAEFELVEGLLQGIMPRRKLFLLDACESGELDDAAIGLAQGAPAGAKARGLSLAKAQPAAGRAGRQFLLRKDRYIQNDLARRSGAIVFSSSRGDEFSFESDEARNGLFTKALIEALRGEADKDADGFVTSDELRGEVAEAVARATGELQHPTVDRDNLAVKLAFPVAPRACPRGMAYLPPGSYATFADLEAARLRGTPADLRTARVPALCMDQTQVTVEAYAECVRAERCGELGTALCDANSNAKGKEKHPVNCVPFKEAADYCSFKGKRLPSEDEWEWAARGAEKGTTYPWGEKATAADQACWTGRDGSAWRSCPVGSFPQSDSPQGIHDLVSSVKEWTSSEDAAATKRYGTARRVTRGGATNRAGERGSQFETGGPIDQGFRCVGDPVVLGALPGKLLVSVNVASECTVGRGAPVRASPDGVAQLEVPAGRVHLFCSAVGYEEARADVEVGAGKAQAVKLSLERAAAAEAAATRIEPKSGLEFVALPGGALLGGNFAGQSVAPFSFGRTAVTAGAYAKCVKAGACSEPNPGSYKCNWNTGRDDHPANCVNWAQAKAFCAWIGGRLPTAQEREWAASGGEGREFPWGKEPPGARACWNGERNDLGKGKRSMTCKVGSYPAGASKHGLLDLAGNVSEWLDSDHDGGKEIRGGWWIREEPEPLGTAFRDQRDPTSWGNGLGFRCRL